MVTDYKAQGIKNRKKGSKTEAQVRAELEAAGYIVCRWQNNVDLEKNKLIGAKPKWNLFTKSISYGGVGFPDFIVIQTHINIPGGMFYSNIAVESKGNGYLDPEERKKAQWLLDHNIFSRFIIAKKTKDGHIVYTDFVTKEQLKVEDLFK